MQFTFRMFVLGFAVQSRMNWKNIQWINWQEVSDLAFIVWWNRLWFFSGFMQVKTFSPFFFFFNSQNCICASLNKGNFWALQVGCAAMIVVWKSIRCYEKLEITSVFMRSSIFNHRIPYIWSLHGNNFFPHRNYQGPEGMNGKV